MAAVDEPNKKSSHSRCSQKIKVIDDESNYSNKLVLTHHLPQLLHLYNLLVVNESIAAVTGAGRTGGGRAPS
jgi:hypothetical protein